MYILRNISLCSMFLSCCDWSIFHELAGRSLTLLLGAYTGGTINVSTFGRIFENAHVCGTFIATLYLRRSEENISSFLS